MSKKTGRAPRFLALDFFCGAGGATCGLIDAGGYVCAGIDNDVRNEMTYVKNNRNRFGDLRSPLFLLRNMMPVDANGRDGQLEEVRDECRGIVRRSREHWSGVPLVFVICAPCQPFTRLSHKSMTVQRLEKRRRDSELLPATAQLIKWFKPEVVICENVAGITSERYGGVWQQFRARLHELGYGTSSEVICASRFGVPQFRRRRVLMAFSALAMQRANISAMPPVPTCDPRAEVVTVRDAISRFPPIRAGESHLTVPNHRARALAPQNQRRLRASSPGKSNERLAHDVTAALALPCHLNLADRDGSWGFSDVYTRMDPDRPAPTITTKSHSVSNGRFGHYDERQLRALSPREAAALQAFPDDYIFYPTHMIEPATRMIGNAVPPLLMKCLADYALDIFESTVKVTEAMNERAAN